MLILFASDRLAVALNGCSVVPGGQFHQEAWAHLLHVLNFYFTNITSPNFTSILNLKLHPPFTLPCTSKISMNLWHKSCSKKVDEIDTCRRFHQHFMHVFFVQNFGAKKHKCFAQLFSLHFGKKKHICTKNARVKCW